MKLNLGEIVSVYGLRELDNEFIEAADQIAFIERRDISIEFSQTLGVNLRQHRNKFQLMRQHRARGTNFNW